MTEPIVFQVTKKRLQEVGKTHAQSFPFKDSAYNDYQMVDFAGLVLEDLEAGYESVNYIWAEDPDAFSDTICKSLP